MIEKTSIGRGLVLITSNEPFSEMDEILEIARNDSSHHLHENYTNVRLSDFLFVNVVVSDGKPSLFYGLQKKDWMCGAARAYTRMYRPPNQRGSLRDSCFIFQNGGYQNLTKWWEPFTDTLFVTRNVEDKRDTLMQITKQRGRDSDTAVGQTIVSWKLHWKPYPFICNINGVEQYVLTMGSGDLNFLRSLQVRPYNE